MGQMIALTKENIQEVVNASMQKLVVFAFYSQQQPESIAQLQTLQQLQQEQFILATVDCDVEVEIAQYFRLQALPTVLIFDQGQMVDGAAGLQQQAELQTMLHKHLPPAWQVQLMAAREILAKEPDQQALQEALSLLQQAQVEERNDEIALALADTYLQLADTVSAENQLAAVGLAGQDSYYQNLMAKLNLAKEAADTPEIRQLQQEFADNEQDLNVRLSLAKALHQARRDEEALALLFAVLQKDLNAKEGDIKASFLSILTAVGQGSPLANQYRRQLYSLLY